MTTVANAVNGAIGETMLTLFVLTSDETEFALTVSESVGDEDDAPLRAMYKAGADKLTGKPDLLLTFAPLLTNIGSDYFIDIINDASGGVPMFGALAVDHNADYHESQVIANGEAWPDRYAMLMLKGGISPSFYIGTISDERLFPEKGVVTGSKGNLLESVNNMPALEYLRSLGIAKDGEDEAAGINAFPIIVDYNDGTEKAIRAVFAATPDYSVVCGGNIPVGATISFGEFNPGEIKATTTKMLEDVIKSGKHSGMLMFSCIGRYFAQGYDQRAELDIVKNLLENTGLSYAASYVGGELCPVYFKSGDTVNRNHNNTFVICAF